MTVRQAIQDVTDRIAARSRDSRRDYLDRLDAAKEQGVYRSALSCGNLAHGFAACSPSEKAALAGNKTLNLGIVNSYNDMLSAHQPYQFYPEIIKQAAREIGATAHPGHVRRRHPGPAGYGSEPVQPRRHRHGDRHFAQPQHV